MTALMREEWGGLLILAAVIVVPGLLWGWVWSWVVVAVVVAYVVVSLAMDRWYWQRRRR